VSGVVGCVLVIIETHQGSAGEVAERTVGAARAIAAAGDREVVAAVLGHGAAAVVERLALGAADRVVAIDHATLATYALTQYRAAALAAARTYGADAVVMAASPSAWDLAPRLAAALDAAFVCDVTQVEIDSGELVCTRAAFGGKLVARLTCAAARAVLTVDAAAFEAADPGVPARIEAFDADWLEAAAALGQRTCARRRATDGGVDLARSEVIVAGGRGVGDAERFHDEIAALAEALGAGLGASRPVVDAGWVARAHQIGSSGQAVRPRVYIACGISGAVQHLAGMRESGVVIAINKDRRAPIFAVADLAIVGDLHEIVPALIDAVRARAI
jgi:electron transfer flavoprotein alpha subunit